MHGNGCESVLRNLPFESGLHGSPDLFSRLSSGSSWPIFVLPSCPHVPARFYVRNNRPVRRDSNDCHENETCSQFTFDSIPIRFIWRRRKQRDLTKFCIRVTDSFVKRINRSIRLTKPNVESVRIGNFIACEICKSVTF